MEKMFGVMLDCSRNAVMNVESVKRFAELIRRMGYNTLMLYTEDTYEVDNQPFFGHLRGRYSKEELKELDRFCNELGMELIPCIQTLAHLGSMFQWPDEYGAVNDCDDILLIGEEKTYQLVEDMIKTISQCFSSKKIHLGMDEAYRVGTGKYQRIHGIQDRFDVINNHLHTVCKIAEKYGLEPMIWSDMFCKLALNIEDQYEHADTAKILEKAKLPENITLVYWDYSSKDYEHYVNNIKRNQMFQRKVIYAGCARTWKGFASNNRFSMETIQPALSACKDCGVDGVLYTVWGNDGGECSKFTILPTLFRAIEYANGNSDMDVIKKKFKDLVGCEWDSFMLFDKIDIFEGKHSEEGSGKYLLYNDLFMGIRDFKCSAENTEHTYYCNLAEEFRGIKEKGAYASLFGAYEQLARVLSVKATLGVRTRKAYLDKDMETLKELVKAYDLVYQEVEDFHLSYQKQWFEENKPHGFDVQDIRIGGLLRRIYSCKNRLLQLIEGEISNIPELEEPVLEQTNHHDGAHLWGRIVTANPIAHAL